MFEYVPDDKFIVSIICKSLWDSLLEQVGGGDVWPERCPVAMGISGVVVHDCRLGGGGGGGEYVPEPGSGSSV